MKHILAFLAAILFASTALAAGNSDTYFGTPGGGGVNGGVGMYVNSLGQAVPETNSDPCSNPSNTKASAAINITTATTTQLVAISGTTTIYICGGSFSIAPSATAAASAYISYGTGTNCGTGLTAITGAYGAGDLTTAAPPLMVNLLSSGVVAIAPAGKALCITTAGATVNVQGIISYVQQ